MRGGNIKSDSQQEMKNTIQERKRVNFKYELVYKLKKKTLHIYVNLAFIKNRSKHDREV